MVQLLVLLALVAGCSADGGIAWRGPPPVKEVFYYNGHSYYLYSEKVGWDEATAICQSNKAILATAEDAGKASFLASAIGDAWAPLEDMWIGAQLTQNMWQWVGISVAQKKNIPETMRQVDNFTFLYPPWVDGAIPYRKGRDCLAIDRNGHSDPYFIDLECKLPRPFICELATEKKSGGPSRVRTVEILDYEFILYHARVNWETAVAFCRSEGYVLATILNSTYAEKLAKAMLKARPEFEDVWIGGSYKNDKWSWVENSLEIPPDPIPSGVKGAVFPPWAHVPPRADKDYCALFDRHLCDTPKFIDVKCNRLRDFVCSRSTTTQTEVPPEYPEKTVRKRKYVVHHTPANFEEAKIICEDGKNKDGKGELLYIDGGQTNDPFDELSNIMQIMSDSKEELIHVWLAAKYNPDSKAFKWIYESPNYESKARPDNLQILPLQTNEETGYPPWCNNDEVMPEMSCLNLDRQNYNTPLYYGLECNASQAFICVVEAKPKGIERFTVKERSYQTSDPKLTGVQDMNHLEASRACELDTGHMIGEIDDQELTEIANNLQDGEYYFGARYVPDKTGNHVLSWPVSKKLAELSSVRIEPYQTGNLCSVLHVADRKAVKIESINCDKKTKNSIICSDKCGGVIDEVQDHTWRCDWHEGTMVTENVLNKVCEKRCPIDTALGGTKKVTCTNDGWIGSRNSKIPECLPPEKAAQRVNELLDQVTQAMNSSGVVYIYDGSADVTTDELQVMKYIIGGSITNIKPSSSARKRRFIRGRWRKNRSKRNSHKFQVPIINLSSESKPEATLESDSVCEVVGKVGTAGLVEPAGRRDYNKAFHEATLKLQEMQPASFSVVVISGGPNQGDDFKDSLRSLKMMAVSVVSIGVGQKYNTEELVDIATSDMNHNLHHMGIADVAVFKKVGDAMPKSSTCDSEIAVLKTNADAAVERIAEAKLLGERQDLPQPYQPPTNLKSDPSFDTDPTSESDEIPSVTPTSGVQTNGNGSTDDTSTTNAGEGSVETSGPTGDEATPGPSPLSTAVTTEDPSRVVPKENVNPDEEN